MRKAKLADKNKSIKNYGGILDPNHDKFSEPEWHMIIGGGAGDVR